MRLSAENTALVLDSTSHLPVAPPRHPGWRVVPLYVQFGDQTFRDYVDLGSDDFYARLPDAAEPPTTSQPTPGDFARVFEELADYERIVCPLISAKLSGTVASAEQAAAALPAGRVLVLDSASASGGIVLLAEAIQRRLEAGTDDAELVALAERYRREARLLFTVDTLDYLVRGGRVGKAAGLAGELLSVKPILTIAEGEVVPRKRVRGRAKALAELEAIFTAESDDVEGLHVGVAHAAVPHDAERLVGMVERTRPRVTIDVVTTLGAVVGTHAGPGTLGLFWFQDAA